MEELIKRLERVIQTGAPDKDGMHPISAETVLEVVKELSEHGTNLAEVGTELISRQSAIDAIRDMQAFEDDNGQPYLYLYDVMAVFTDEEELPTIHPEPHWIPVTERPKEEEKSYWVCLEDGGQCQCRWTNDIYGLGANEWSKWGWKKVDLPQFSKVVAYMPLPEPYKGVTT